MYSFTTSDSRAHNAQNMTFSVKDLKFCFTNTSTLITSHLLCGGPFSEPLCMWILPVSSNNSVFSPKRKWLKKLMFQQ